MYQNYQGFFYFFSSALLGLFWMLREFTEMLATSYHFTGVYLVFEMFRQEWRISVSYLVLRACILLLRCFRQGWPISVIALLA